MNCVPLLGAGRLSDEAAVPAWSAGRDTRRQGPGVPGKVAVRAMTPQKLLDSASRATRPHQTFSSAHNRMMRSEGQFLTGVPLGAQQQSETDSKPGAFLVGGGEEGSVRIIA